jgi:hypothetical protein
MNFAVESSMKNQQIVAEENLTRVREEIYLEEERKMPCGTVIVVLFNEKDKDFLLQNLPK